MRWFEQADADQPVVVVDALDCVPVELELADDHGREVNPAGAQVLEGDWLPARAAQLLERPQLLGFSQRPSAGLSRHAPAAGSGGRRLGIELMRSGVGGFGDVWA